MNEYNVINTSQKKSDWNANEGEAGYIKNRTHYETVNETEVTHTFTIPDGYSSDEYEETNPEDDAIIQAIYNAYVADAEETDGNLVFISSGKIKINGTEHDCYLYLQKISSESVWGVSYLDKKVDVSSLEDVYAAEFFVVSENPEEGKGILYDVRHFNIGQNEISCTVPQTTVKKIDPKFLPDMGGGGDWNASEGETGYIANRTHWIETGNSITGTFTLSQEDIEQEEAYIENSAFAEEVLSIFGRHNVFNEDVIINNQIYKVDIISSIDGEVIINSADHSFMFEFGDGSIYIFIPSISPFVVGENTIIISNNTYHKLNLNYIEDTMLWQRGSGLNSIKTHDNEASGDGSYAEGYSTTASGDNSHAEGSITTASGSVSHAEGFQTTASGNNSHAEGYVTTASSNNSHAEGNNTRASGEGSHAEGTNTIASGEYSHAEGYHTTASENETHAEGGNTIASGYRSHAEGGDTTASGGYSHAEGNNTTASGYSSHAEGSYTNASGQYCHSEGNNTTASGDSSHAEGYYTIANHSSQHVFGEYNIQDPSTAAIGNRGTYVEIVGNGSSNNHKSNARTLDWSGNEVLAGSVSPKGGLILESPDGSSYTLTMNNDGTLKITKNT